MENGGGGVSRKIISADDVISKLKDDGDFDRLRVRIIRKVKDNEELRNNIISMVKQSTALNRPGAENMKPRQLSDAIHQEVGDKVMSQISESLWKIIRSQDGMKNEITETVQSVYSKLVNPVSNEEVGSSSHDRSMPVQMQVDNNGCHTASPGEVSDTSDNEPQVPPGFCLQNHDQNNHFEELPKEELHQSMDQDMANEEQRKESHDSVSIEAGNGDPSLPPGFCSMVETNQQCDGNDDDPDVPPGFG